MEIESTKNRKVSGIFAIAILLAAIFDYLFFGKQPGISILVYATLLLVTLYILCVKFARPYRSAVWVFVPILFFALMPAIRANMFLNLLNMVAVLGLLLLTAKEILREHILKFGIKEYFSTVVIQPLKILASTFIPIRYALKVLSQSSKGWRRVLVGLIIALPVLVVFTLLFSSADLAFGQFINSIISLHIPDIFFGHTVVVGIIFIILLGTMEYLFHVADGSEVVATAQNAETPTTGREVETGVFLSLISALFLIFIGFQITYLFGGQVNISNRGFTYAEYARHGFWELLVVASATLVVLFFTDKLTRRPASRRIWFTIPSTVMILEIFVIIASAFKRLMLYENAYGLTTLRFYVSGFIIFLAVVFGIQALKFILEKKENFFTFGTLLTMIVFLMAVNFVNPDDYIARKNIARFNQAGKIDIGYLANLSTDGVTRIGEVYDQLSDAEKNTVRDIILANQLQWEKSLAHWQSYNYSRSQGVNKLHTFILEKFGPCAGNPDGQCLE